MRAQFNFPSLFGAAAARGGNSPASKQGLGNVDDCRRGFVESL